MCPTISINYMAVAAAVAASFVFGFLWYGPLFGKTWAGLMGIKMDKECKPAAWVFVVAIIGTFLTVYVMNYSTKVWMASSWGLSPDKPAYMYGFFSGFFTWLGFYVPMLLGHVTWEGKPWKLFGLNAVYYFLNLQIIAMILAYWR